MSNFMRYDLFFSTPNRVTPLELHAIVKKVLPNYTLNSHSGAWDSIPEHSYSVTMIDNDATVEEKIITLGKVLKEVYCQQAVFLTSQPINAKLI